MKEEWLFPGAVIPVDLETTAALVAVRFAMEQAKEQSPIPFLTAEQWAELNAEKE